MKRSLIFLLIISIGIVSCKDDDTPTNPSLEEYFETYGIINTKTTELGVIYIIEEEGEGILPVAGDVVKVHYTGFLTNNEIFDTSFGRDPLEFVLGAEQVIPGFDDGMALFRTGGKGILFIPSELAYGEQGAGAVISPGDDLIFEVTMEEVVPELSRIDINFYIEFNELTGFTKTASGMYYQITQEGTGDTPTTGQTVTIEYTGYLLNDEIFDSTIKKGQSFTFEIGSTSVIEGLSEAATLLNVGARGEFLIPSELAFGSTGTSQVDPDLDVRYTVSLTSID